MDHRWVIAGLAISWLAAPAAGGETARLEGRVVDADSGELLAARLTIEGSDGRLHHARSAEAEGSAVAYEKRRGSSVEVHTTLSAHPFIAELPPGKYVLVAERGKEYLPAREEVDLASGPASATLRLKRWINMAALGWYSGDTHVHRPLEELPNLLLAEDLNVAFPLTHWVTRAFQPPAGGDRSAGGDPGAALIEVDPTHVIWPRNTEYEIFTVGDKRHELGAFFVLNHRAALERGVPPVKPAVEGARAEGALIELDKHAWPWSMALVPVLKVDLYELSNNHVWRARFGFPGWGAPAAPYMRIDRDRDGWTERGWIDYGFKNYYALLNCGFRLRPTAGTASGVHPVPLGFSRVYVRLDGVFSYAEWIRGLDRGRSFVTTGPMLLAEVEVGDPPTAGAVVRAEILGAGPLDRVEIIQDGEIAALLRPPGVKTPSGAYRSEIRQGVRIEGSSWIAVRAFEWWIDGRTRFAHTAPVFIDLPGRPLRPRLEEVEYLMRRVSEQIDRSRDVLPPEALDEYREALRAYEKIAETARRN